MAKTTKNVFQRISERWFLLEPTLFAVYCSHQMNGRDGTDFQCVIDYANTARCYDGLIIITDGCAPPPSIPQGFRPRLLWICEDQQAYDSYHQWMQQTGRVCTIN